MERRLLNARRIEKRPSKWIRQLTELRDVITAYRTRKWKHLHKMLMHGQERYPTIEMAAEQEILLGRPPTR